MTLKQDRLHMILHVLGLSWWPIVCVSVLLAWYRSEQMNIFIGIEKIQGIVYVWEYEKGKKPKYDFDSFFNSPFSCLSSFFLNIWCHISVCIV